MPRLRPQVALSHFPVLNIPVKRIFSFVSALDYPGLQRADHWRNEGVSSALVLLS